MAWRCSTTPRSSTCTSRADASGAPWCRRPWARACWPAGPSCWPRARRSLDWLGEAWGPAAANCIVRGTPCSTGRVLRLMLDAGAAPVGDARACHAVAVDARAPKFDGGIVTRLDCVPLGIVVNARGERFYDEGEDVWPKRYAIWGSLVALAGSDRLRAHRSQGGGPLHARSVFPAIEAGSIRELAAALELPADAVEQTVRAFNQAVRPGRFDHAVLDDCRTEGLTPPKSHWAQTLDTPPFLAYPLRPASRSPTWACGSTPRARVQMQDGRPAANVFAAGEIMAGNILRRGYVAGVGMTIGTVFGRLAGKARRAMPSAELLAGALRR
ncbi:MAG: FAD-binding protein [Vicinamibacterales bacterium]